MNELFDVFISYSHEDQLEVEHLAEQLRCAGINVWLDKWNCIAGNLWQNEIEQALAIAKSCAVCYGDGLSQRGWFSKEIAVALDRNSNDKNFQVIPIILPGGSEKNINRFLRQNGWINFYDGICEKEFGRLINGIRAYSTNVYTQINKNDNTEDLKRDLDVLMNLFVEKRITKEIYTGLAKEIIQLNLRTYSKNG